MADTTDQLDVIELIKAELGNIESDSSGWDAPIVCRVEVDLPSWLSQLTGGEAWEVYAEDEEESCISFAMREVSAKTPICSRSGTRRPCRQKRPSWRRLPYITMDMQ